MTFPRIIQRILEGIRKSQSFCVAGHVRPDGDCVGSQLALALALRAQGKDVVCWNEDAIPSKLAFLDPDNLLSKPEPGRQFDCVIATDCASFEQLGEVGQCIAQRQLFINIDHHPSNTRFADINWVSARPSAGELIFRLLNTANWPITPPIANCLFTAVSTDTGSFQHSTTRPETYYVAGKLVERGADPALVCDEIYHSYPLSRVRLLQHVLNNFRLTAENQIAYFWVRQADYQRTGALPQDSEGLIDHIRAIDPVLIACMFEEMEENVTRISLRSKCTQVNVSQIAKEFGGGGHLSAAGARINGSPLSIQRCIVNALRRALLNRSQNHARL